MSRTLGRNHVLSEGHTDDTVVVNQYGLIWFSYHSVIVDLIAIVNYSEQNSKK